ncbi:Uncharacterized membrane protein YlbC [Durusdinium trenchii]|uniref:Uncharacterized membrane protein YlbC n=1 Tax=Durusdinium trenchii TaxID=1381693 RepID=A0ABP0KLF8_9DINO
MGSKPSSCRVRNRLGCPVQLDAVPSSGSSSSTARISACLVHGGEQLIQVENHSPEGVLVAVRFPWQGSEVNKVFTVPNEAVLLLRAFEKGELAFRVTRADGGSEAAVALEGPALEAFRAAHWPCPQAPEVEVVPPDESHVKRPRTEEVPTEAASIPASSETAVIQVSDAPMCFATGSGEWVDADPTGCDGEEDLDELIEVSTAQDVEVKDDEAPSHWTELQLQLFCELRDFQIPAVRARKAIDADCADVEEAIAWIERHQEDEDIDVSPEMLRAREEEEVALAVLRLLTVPALHRLSCLQGVHRVLRNILADPESSRVRQIRLQNPRFRERIGRFPAALALLTKIGFQKGDFWTSAYERQPCLEWRHAVGSANAMSQRMERAFSLLDEVLRNPDAWIPATCAAMPEVKSDLVDVNEDSSLATDTARELLAEVHARRAKDPRKFQQAMRDAGRRPNPSVYRLVPRAPTAQRPLEERFPGKREFNLQDLENMRVEEAIGNMPLYAKEYETSLGQASSYGQLVNRSYDPNYLARRALDETNIFRGSEKMPPMKWCQGIADIAAEHARQMARGDMPFSHDGFEDRVRRYPIPHMSAAENLAYNGGVADTAGVAVQGWIKSPGHRKNLLGAFDLCGIGVARASTGEFFFTQLFARSAGGPLC